MSEDEILDIVNGDDEVIGTIHRRDYARLVEEKLGNIRFVDMYIQNDNGELWVPTRTADKTIAPNGLDYSVAGHVESGEDYDTTIYREAEEEINVQLDPSKLTMVKKFGPDGFPYFRCFYIYRMNETPVYNPDDFVSAEWMTPQQLVDKIKAGAPAKSNILTTVTEIFNP